MWAHPDDTEIPVGEPTDSTTESSNTAASNGGTTDGSGIGQDVAGVDIKGAS